MTNVKDRLCDAFKQAYGRAPDVVARAPGRLEILGNHTDYNEGCALSCAVDKATWFAAAPTNGTSSIRSVVDFDTGEQRQAEADVTALGQPTRGAWQNYVLGVIVELQRRGHTVGNFDAMLCSDVPMSSGMSSSAALEMAAAYALGKLNDISLAPTEWARVGQASENNYVGANTGLLDQISSTMAQADHLVHIDFRDLSVETEPMSDEVVVVVANSGVKHDLTADYNERRARCEEAAAALSVTFLRDVGPAALEHGREAMSITAYRRALHVVGENDRVARAREALRQDDMPALGRLLLESHASSRENFENSCPELDFLVAAGSSLPGCLGARLSGGGFGGISIHLVEREQAQTYVDRLRSAFKTEFDRDPAPMICNAGAGASIQHV